jgi:hypothetical protein
MYALKINVYRYVSQFFALLTKPEFSGPDPDPTKEGEQDPDLQILCMFHNSNS